MLDHALWVGIGFLSGSIPWALVIGKFISHKDVREVGDGNPGSVNAWKSGGLTSGTAYSSSKAGMVGLTFTVAKEVAEFGVTVNGIAPAYVMSPMVMDQLTEEQRQELLKLIPVRRFSEPDEVAHAVRFLVSPLAAFITGEIIDMNGGFQFD